MNLLYHFSIALSTTYGDLPFSCGPIEKHSNIWKWAPRTCS